MSNFHAFEAAPGQLAAHRWVGLAAAFAGFGWYLWCFCSVGGEKKSVSIVSFKSTVFTTVKYLSILFQKYLFLW